MSENEHEYSTKTTSVYEMVETCFTWKIPKVLSVTAPFIESPTFAAANGTEWSLSLGLGILERRSLLTDDISLDLQLKKGPTPEKSFKCSNSLLVNARKYFENETYLNADMASGDRRNLWQFPDFLKRKKLASPYLVNDNLNILCKLVLQNGQTIKLPPHISSERLLTFSQDSWNLYNNKTFTDITFVVDGNEIQAHKLVFTTRSTVFETMFDTEMVEGIKNRVEIEDIDMCLWNCCTMSTQVLQKKIDKMAKPLLLAAEKYALHGLREMCEKSLSEQLTAQNACELFIFADLISSANLEAKAFECIRGNLEAVLDSDGYSLLFPLQVKKIFKEVAKKK